MKKSSGKIPKLFEINLINLSIDYSMIVETVPAPTV